MVKHIMKRDGRSEPFDKAKILSAIYRAYREGDTYVPEPSGRIAASIEQDPRTTLNVEEVQDLVEQGLVNERLPDVAKRYILYRAERSRVRRERSALSRRFAEILDGAGVQNSNANVDEASFGGRKFEVANALHRELALEKYISPEVARAHREHRIYIHDLSEYTIGDHNCLFVDLPRLLANGFETRNGSVRSAQSFSTACQLVAVIFQCQSQVQFGGVASAHIDYDLAPYVMKSFAKYMAEGLVWLEGAPAESLLDFIDGISIEDRAVDQWPRAKAYALAMLEKEGRQAAQGLYHNLNTLESRAGSQLPFSSINFGTDTSPEGRLVTEWLLEASIAGIGKHRTTPIFPISVFKYKRGVNDVPGTPNYDLRLLSEQSLCRRIYPNIANCGFSRNKENGNPDTEMATMGCVERSEVVTYKIYDKLFIEGTGKMFDRLSLYGMSKQGGSEYIQTEGRGVSVYDTISGGFVECKKVIRNPDVSDWYNVKLDNGRSLLATGDHPLPIVRKGRTFVKDVAVGDSVPVMYNQYAEESTVYSGVITPYVDALVLCDGSYANGVVAYFGLDETDIIEKARQEASSLGYNVAVVKKERGLERVTLHEREETRQGK